MCAKRGHRREAQDLVLPKEVVYTNKGARVEIREATIGLAATAKAKRKVLNKVAGTIIAMRMCSMNFSKSWVVSRRIRVWDLGA
ncbi:hypothetical protein BYT27DRAFT_7197593, partial [Phlegmacium glaucopus]